MIRRSELETDEETSARMRRIRRRDTKPELLLRRWLWSEGARFTTRNGDLPGSPDLANRSRRWAIFVHGCFWHGHPNCKKSKLPSRNADFWRDKIGANVARDERKAAEVRDRGFAVLTVWECQLKSLVDGKPEADELRDKLRRMTKQPTTAKTRSEI